jgi:fatty acid synthase subunit beta
MSSSEHSTFSDTPFTSPCASPPQKYRHNASITASLSYKILDIDFRIPSELHIRTAQLIDQYLHSLNCSTEENDPKTLLGLVTRFLRFIIDGKQHILDTEILTTVLVAFEQNFLLNDDIHCLAISPDAREEEDVDIIGIYYRACALTNRDHDGRMPALLRAADKGDACLYTIFGGQGNTEKVFEDLRAVHRT